MAMNAQFLGKSRPRLADGDVFRMIMPGDIELFGLVALASIEKLPGSDFAWEQCTLVYVYIPGMLPRDSVKDDTQSFILPPLVTNRLGFTRFGVWQRVESPRSPDSYSGVDRFRLRKNGKYCDVWGRPTSERDALPRLRQVDRIVHPNWSGIATDYGLTPVPMIDDMISDALGIPRAPVTPEDFK